MRASVWRRETRSRRLTKQVEAVLGALAIRSLESDVEGIYAAIRVALEKKGTPIGAHDMLIAAHARALDAVCVTDNVAEFKRVPAQGRELVAVGAIDTQPSAVLRFQLCGEVREVRPVESTTWSWWT